MIDLDELDRLHGALKDRKGAFPFTDFFTAIHAAYPELRARIRELESLLEPDIATCPGCGGDADNGFDRGLPPSPYYCTRCTDSEHLRAQLVEVTRERDEWKACATARLQASEAIDRA